MKSICYIFLLFLPLLSLGQCPVGDLLLNTQAQVDDFATTYPGCTQMDGELMIFDPGITNLNGLSVLESVGSLTIAFTTGLTNVSGLQGLELTGANPKISLDNNSGLTSIFGLISSVSNACSVLITNNSSLTSLDGLSGIPQLDSFAVINNAALSDFTGLEDVLGIEAPNGFIEITSNNQLQSFDGLFNVLFSGTENNITIGGNPQLTSINGFMANGSTIRRIVVASNDVLPNLDGLEGTAGSSLEDLIVLDNTMLTDISSLANTEFTGATTLIIEGNQLLSVCNILSICNYLADDGPANISNNASGCNSVPEVEEACLLAVNEHEIEVSVYMYPNPVTTTFHVVAPKNVIFEALSLYEITGKEIERTFSETLDMSEFPSGIYFVKIMTDQGIVSKKIVKE
ncbi:MAG: T9SS type A sorting domain-containing protein [Bacteroidota bacterium]